jgi:hypothetical protein
VTDFTVFQTGPFQSEDLTWNITPPENEFFLGGTLDLTAFNAAQHYPNGYIPSGTLLAIKAAGGLLIPYLGAGTGGQQTAVGILRHSLQVVRFVGGSSKTKLGAAYMVHGMVSQARLPFNSTNAALGGYVDAAAKTALPLIYWAA